MGRPLSHCLTTSISRFRVCKPTPCRPIHMYSSMYMPRFGDSTYKLSTSGLENSSAELLDWPIDMYMSMAQPIKSAYRRTTYGSFKRVSVCMGQVNNIRVEICLCMFNVHIIYLHQNVREIDLFHGRFINLEQVIEGLVIRLLLIGCDSW